MSVIYFHLAPVILTDNLYEAFGGRVEESTVNQRKAAYQIAESLMIEELHTFLLPTTVTGTWEFNDAYPRRIRLPHHHVITVDAVTILSKESLCNCNLDEDDGCHYMVSNLYGYVDIKQLTQSALVCGCSLVCPYQARIAYTAGLPTGTAALDSALHLALTMVAENVLLEIIEPEALEGGPGDQGVQEYVSMGYGEKRVKLKRTVFGTSPRANKAKEFVKHLSPKIAGRLGR